MEMHADKHMDMHMDTDRDMDKDTNRNIYMYKILICTVHVQNRTCQCICTIGILTVQYDFAYVLVH